MNFEKYAELVKETTAASWLCPITAAMRDATRPNSTLSGRGSNPARSPSPDASTNSPTETPGIFPEQILADATRVSLTQAMQPFKRAEAVELMPEFGAALDRTGRSTSIMSTCWLAVSPASTSPPSSVSLTATGSSPRSPRGPRRPSSGEHCATRSAAPRKTMASIASSGSGATPGCVPGPTSRPGCGASAASSTPRPVRSSTAPQRRRRGVVPRHHTRHLSHRPARQTTPLRALALLSLTSGKGTRARRVDRHVGADRRQNPAGGCARAHGDRLRAGHRPPRRNTPPDGLLRRDHPNHRRRRRRPPPPRPHHTPRQPRATPRPPGDVPRLRHPGLLRRLGLRRHPPPQMVPQPRTTDIDNLLPLCTKHHHLAHEGRWQLTLDPNATSPSPNPTAPK